MVIFLVGKESLWLKELMRAQYVVYLSKYGIPWRWVMVCIIQKIPSKSQHLDIKLILEAAIKENS